MPYIYGKQCQAMLSSGSARRSVAQGSGRTSRNADNSENPQIPLRYNYGYNYDLERVFILSLPWLSRSTSSVFTVLIAGTGGFTKRIKPSLSRPHEPCGAAAPASMSSWRISLFTVSQTEITQGAPTKVLFSRGASMEICKKSSFRRIQPPYKK